jgi:hypothetical protein
MTLYHVHIYREMKLLFNRIEADTPEAAAAIARDKPTDDADHIDDCDGENLAALVDVLGDEQYEKSVTIDFEAERLRKAAPRLLNALIDLLGDLPSVQNGTCVHCGREYHDVETGNCPSEDCPSFEPRALIAELGTLPIKSPSSPARPLLVVVSVRGGMVTDARSNGRLTVIVEDWDCPGRAAPVTFDFEPEPLAEAEEQRFIRRFNLSNQQGA